MHNLALAVPVRQVEGDDVETGQLRQRVRAGLVRPVAEPHEQRSLVEPDQIAALGEGRRVKPSGDRNSRPRELDAERLGLGAAPWLPGPEQHGALVRDQHRVEDVDRVRVALHGRLGEDDLGPGAGEQLAESLVLARDCHRVRLAPPAALAPEPELLGPWRPKEHPTKRCGHVRTAVKLWFNYALIAFKSSWRRRGRRRT